MQLALKVDVDTLRGTLEGVPALIDALQAAGADASFLFSLGPDHTGRALRRVFRPGFFSKVSRTSVLEHYGLRTLLYGTLLPGPDIGRRGAAVMRRVRDAGFEVGIHCFDHTSWQDFVTRRDEAWTRRQMLLAVERFREVFGASPARAWRGRLADERGGAGARGGARLRIRLGHARRRAVRAVACRVAAAAVRSCRPRCRRSMN